jgi:hypothetical protein
VQSACGGGLGPKVSQPHDLRMHIISKRQLKGECTLFLISVINANDRVKPVDSRQTLVNLGHHLEK